MKVLLVGASGTAGGAVLSACLKTPVVEEVRAIVRRPLAREDPKLRGLVHANYAEYASAQDAFRGCDACLFCLGTSVTQASRDDFVKISHDYPLAAAKMLKAQSPGAAFHYISGAGTRAKSRTFWANVKGQTENELMELVDAVCWRPAFIDAKPSATLPRMYAAMWPVFRSVLKPFHSMYIAGEDLGFAMLEATREHLRHRVIENTEIHELARWFHAS